MRFGLIENKEQKKEEKALASPVADLKKASR
jgi:hypothetical protein